jgi:hypothetical protein
MPLKRVLKPASALAVGDLYRQIFLVDLVAVDRSRPGKTRIHVKAGDRIFSLRPSETVEVLESR